MAARNLTGFAGRIIKNETHMRDLTTKSKLDETSDRYAVYKQQLEQGFSIASKVFAQANLTCEMPRAVPVERPPSPRVPQCHVMPRRPNNAEEWDLMNDLAQRFAPVLHFHQEETAFPTSVDEFINNSELKTHHEKGTYYALNDTKFRIGNPDFTNAVVYTDYFVRGHVANIRYYIFFAATSKSYTGFKVKTQDVDLSLDRLMQLNTVGVHEGDFETVEIHVDMRDQKLLGLTTWQHVPNLHAKPVYHPVSELTQSDDHPHFYIALGTHTAYTTPGRHRLYGALSRCQNEGQPVFVGLDLHDRADGNGRTWRVTSSQLQPVRDPRQGSPEWMSFTGHFGDMISKNVTSLACTKFGMPTLIHNLQERLNRVVPFVANETRNHFAESYVNWMCGYLSNAMFPYLDDSEGIYLPFQARFQTASNVEQVRQCESTETFTAERIAAYKELEAANQRTKEAGDVAEQERVKLVQLTDAQNQAELKYKEEVRNIKSVAYRLDEARESLLHARAEVRTFEETVADLELANKREEGEEQPTETDKIALIAAKTKLENAQTKISPLETQVNLLKEEFLSHAKRVNETQENFRTARKAVIAQQLVYTKAKFDALAALKEQERFRGLFETALKLEAKARERELREREKLLKEIKDVEARRLEETKIAMERAAIRQQAIDDYNRSIELAAQAAELQRKLAQEKAEALAAQREAALKRKEAEIEAIRRQAEERAREEAMHRQAQLLEQKRKEAEAELQAAQKALAEASQNQEKLVQLVQELTAKVKAAEAEVEAQRKKVTDLAAQTAAATGDAHAAAVSAESAARSELATLEKKLADLQVELRKAETSLETLRKRIAEEEAAAKAAEEKAKREQSAKEAAAKAEAEAARLRHEAEMAQAAAKLALQEAERIKKENDAAIAVQEQALAAQLAAERAAAEKAAAAAEAENKARAAEEMAEKARAAAEREAAEAKLKAEAESNSHLASLFEAAKAKREKAEEAAEKAYNDAKLAIEKLLADAKLKVQQATAKREAAKLAADDAATAVKSANEAVTAQHEKISALQKEVADKNVAVLQAQAALAGATDENREELTQALEAAKTAHQEAAKALSLAQAELKRLQEIVTKASEAAKAKTDAYLAAQKEELAAIKASSDAQTQATKMQAEAQAKRTRALEEARRVEQQEIEEARRIVARELAEARKKAEQEEAARKKKAAEEEAAAKAAAEKAAAEKAAAEKAAAEKKAAEEKAAEEARRAAEKAEAERKAAEEKAAEEARRRAEEEAARLKEQQEAEAKRAQEEAEAAKKKAEEEARLAEERAAAEKAAEGRHDGRDAHAHRRQ